MKDVILKGGAHLSKETNMVIKCFNSMTEREFMKKFACSKRVYLKRFIKYGDPFMNAPRAKFGKLILKYLKK